MDAIHFHYLSYCSIYSWDLKVGPLIDLSVFLKINLVVLVSIDFLNFRQKRGWQKWMKHKNEDILQHWIKKNNFYLKLKSLLIFLCLSCKKGKSPVKSLLFRDTIVTVADSVVLLRAIFMAKKLRELFFFAELEVEEAAWPPTSNNSSICFSKEAAIFLWPLLLKKAIASKV